MAENRQNSSKDFLITAIDADNPRQRSSKDRLSTAIDSGHAENSGQSSSRDYFTTAIDSGPAIDPRQSSSRDSFTTAIDSGPARQSSSKDKFTTAIDSGPARQSSSKDKFTTAIAYAKDLRQDSLVTASDSSESDQLDQKSLKGSFSKASGDSDESFCEPCMNNRNWVAVEGYCQVCQEYLCVSCLSVHRSQKMTRLHTILDKDQMPKGQESNANQELCVEVCKTHHLQIVRFYCPAHNEAGCVDCMTINHTSCQKDSVQDSADGFLATKEYKMIQKQLDKILHELEEMKDTLEDNLKNLGSAYDLIQDQVSSFRQQVNDYLDSVQKQLTEEITTLKKQYETEMKQVIANNEAMRSEVEHTLQKLQNDPGVNVNSIFVITKQAMKRLVTMQTEMNRMDLTGQEQKFEYEYMFLPSPRVQDLVSDSTPLGSLEKNHFINAVATHTGMFNVKSKDDENNCWITDSTLVSMDTMVAVDNLNKNIKLLDLCNNRVLTNYRTPSTPEGVTRVNTDQIAVTLPYDCKIQLYNIKDRSTFIKHREIQVQNACRNIAYKNETFAVSYAFQRRSSIEIIDTLGQVLYKMSKESDIALLMPVYITFGHEKETLSVSAPWTNEIKLITFQGQTLNTFKHDTLSSPHGIELQKDGYLLVCSRGSDCIHVISPDFTTSTIILRDDSNIRQPTSITYSAKHRNLYICSMASRRNVIQVYSLNATNTQI